VVVVCLICPVSLPSEFSLMSLLQAPVTSDGKIQYVALDTNGTDTPSVTISAPAAYKAAPSFKQDPTVKPFTVSVSGISILWLCGTAAMLTLNIVRLAQIRRKLIWATPLRDNIFLADHITTPFVLGIIRPKIYLPSYLSDTERPYIICHEKHHIRRGDHIIKLFAFGALCVHWFNPLVWLAFALASKDMEMSCDEAVMKQVGNDIRADYSLSLLQFSTEKKIISGTPLAFGEGDTKERIKNIMKYRKPTFAMVALALFICIISAACISSDPPVDAKQHGLAEISIDSIDLSASTDVGVELAYESADFIIFYGSIGLFGYDLNKEQITFAVDLIKAVGAEGSIQGSRGTSVKVSADGKTIVVSDYDSVQDVRYKTCYIDIPKLTYTVADYKPLDSVFDRDTAKGYIYPGVKTEQVKYITDEKEWVIFAD